MVHTYPPKRPKSRRTGSDFSSSAQSAEIVQCTGMARAETHLQEVCVVKKVS